MSLPATTRLGVLDWGIGGVDAFRRLRARYPTLPMTYWSDSGFTPYGKVPAPALAARIAEVAGRMAVTHLVVACNAASTVLDAAPLPVPTVGVIAPGVALALRSPARILGVVGGERTIASGAWERPLVAAGREVRARVAQPLSAHVEAGRLDGPELERDLADILAPLVGVDALILACTHYPAIAGAFARRLPGVTLLDPVDALLDAVAAWPLADSGGDGDLRVLTTGDPSATREAARRAFGVDLGPVEGVTPV
ncbi:MAG: glutamate racemase [Deltaproteobacteria bacterium]|nr:MAG: glutamate racemase [Deltaproteobacteria bacterium]